MVPRLNCCTTPDGLEPGILSVHDGGKKPNISRLGPVFLLREKKKKAVRDMISAKSREGRWTELNNRKKNPPCLE